MKKIYFLILACVFAITCNAQLSLTKAFNEPAVGNMNVKLDFDTAGIDVPKNIGANQTWDFSVYSTTYDTTKTTYVNVSATPNGSGFSSATLADDDANGTYNYYKATSTQFELVGIDNPQFTLNFSSNTAIAAVWPVNFGYNNTDAFSGTAAAFGQTGTANGTVTTMGTGTGTVMLPNGITLTNMLQVKTTQKINVSLLFGAITVTVDATSYDYYHGSQKFPIVTLSYNVLSGAQSGTQATLKMNNAVVVGINDKNFDATFNVFPNPAKENFSVALTNNTNQFAKIEVINSVGAIARTVDLGNASKISKNISISDLATGIYMVKTTIGDKTSVRKLIVE